MPRRIDVTFLEAAERERDRLHLDVYRPEPRRKDKFFLKIFRNLEDAIPISDLLPMLENMGLKVIAERPYGLEFAGGRRAWIQDLELNIQGTARREIRRARGRDQERVHRRVDRPHGFGQLQPADADGRRAVAPRGGAARLLPVSAANRPALQPGLHRPGAGQQSRHRARSRGPVRHALRSRPLRHGAPQRPRAARSEDPRPSSRRSPAPTRTGSCAPCGARCRRRCAPTPTSSPRAAGLKDYLSFKIESQKLRELPLPKPMFEIFVFSTRMEGVHLRMGFVARGGIRWSDRREDFRTEVLGLMKAQQVKNTVIVPVGAKGGFVVRRPLTGDRDSAARRGDRVLPDADPRHARSHRQHRRGQDRRRRRGRCATTATMPISWSPPTRARRPSRTSPTPYPRNTDSGWAMPSPRADRRATTTRKWPSPRAAPGNA